MAALDLSALGLLPPLPTAYLKGEELDLLRPLRLLRPGQSPEGPSAAVDRSELAEALAGANEGWLHPGAAEMASRLADPETLVVVTGQQPGLLGGPLYTLSKAIAAARWAARLEAAGRSAVAVFWVATEDHDFAEVARADVPVGNRLERLSLGEDSAPLAPVGGRILGSGVGEITEAWGKAYNSEAYRDWVQRVSAWYHPDASIGDAFCRLMVGMLGERCPLLLDAASPSTKRAQRRGLRRLVEDRSRLEERTIARDELIESRGYSLQVRPQRGTSPLFLLHRGARRRIEWRGDDRFTLRGEEGFEESVASLLSVIEDDPGRVSPGVLARPALQDLILGTHLQILGPGEMSYMAQAAPAYETLEVEAPWVTLRPQALVLGQRQWQQAEAFDIALEDLVTGRLAVAETVAELSGDDFVAPVRDAVERQMDALEAPALALDKTLEQPLRKTRDQMRRALEAFSGKVAAAAARRHEVMARRIENLIATVRPGGSLQERSVASAHFVGKHPDFVEAMWRQLSLDGGKLHLIDPERREP